jgi:TolA-binding protein
MTVWVGLVALAVGFGASLFMPVPQSLKTNFDAGQSLYALGEYEGAIFEYNKIVKFQSRAVREDSVRVSFGDELELPVVAAAWYQLGNSYKKSGQHDEAVKAYLRVVEIAGVLENFRSLVQFQVAETRFLQKEYDKAATQYKRYVELFPDSDIAGKAFFYSGWSEFNLKQYDESIKTLHAMLEAYPEDRYAPDAQFRIASSHYEKDQFQRAIDEAQIVANKYPKSPMIAQAEYLKANSYDKLGQDEDAIAAYRQVRGLYNRMFELLRGSFREGKNVDFENFRQLFETSSLRVAEIFRKTDQFEEAYKELIAAQETAEERFYKARVQMRIGDNYMEWKRYDDAWTAYNQVIELYPDTPYPPQAQFFKGEARYYGGKYAEARDEYLQVPEKYPDSDTELRSAALYTAGWSAEKMENYEEAIKQYSEVVNNFPRSDRAPDCLLRIGRVNLEQQRLPEAEKAYLTLTDTSETPNYSQTSQSSDAYYGLGVLYRDSDRLNEAITAFSQVDRDAGRTYIAALIEAANIHIGAGRSDKGRQLLTQLLEGVKGDLEMEGQAHYQMAQLDLNNENYTDAIKGYTKVIKEYPTSGAVRDAHYGRALSYHYAGRYNKAVEDYDWLLATDLQASMKLRVEYSLALSYAALGRDPEAQKLLNLVIASGDANLARNARLQLISMAEKQDPVEAAKTYAAMLENVTADEDQVRILSRLANAYFKLQQYQKSIDASQQLINLALDAESVSKALFIQGNSYFKGKDYEQAIIAYRKIVDNYPQISWANNALFQMGMSYQKLSDKDLNALPAVSKTFSDYYATYPEDKNALFAHYYDAWARWRMGKWREASETFLALSNKYPRSKFASEALFRAGDAIFNMRGAKVSNDEKYTEAMALYEQVVSRYPKSEHVDDALYNKAWCLINLKREAESVPLFEEIVERFADGRYGPRSQFSLGDFYYGTKEYDKATEKYEKFLALFPNDKLFPRAQHLLGQLGEIDAYNLYSKGEALFDQKDFDNAIKIFEEVQNKYPQSDQAVNAAVNIGAAYVAQEEFREAGAIFKGVVDKYGGNSDYLTQVEFAQQQLQILDEAGVI